MQRGVVARLLFLGILTIALVAMAVHYGASAPRHEPYPTGEDITRDYSAHIGERVYFWSRVVRTTPDRLVVRTGSLTLSVETPTTADPGDVAQVYGTLRNDRRVDARRVVVSKRGEMRYMYAISGLAGLLTAGLFLRSWRFDPRMLSFRSRKDRYD